MKIYLKPDEEIVSAVDKLIQSTNDRINLVVPPGAQIWQSSINLKLLKREADYLNKEVVLVVADDLSAEIAEKAGFKVKREADLEVELVSEEQDDFSGSESEPQALRKAEMEDSAEEPEEQEPSQLDSSAEPRIDYGIDYQARNQDNDIISRLAQEMDSSEKMNKFKSFLAKGRKGKKINFASVDLRTGKRGKLSDKKIADIVIPEAEKDQPLPEKPKKRRFRFSKIKKEKEPEEILSESGFSQAETDVLKPRSDLAESRGKASWGWLKLVGLLAIVGIAAAGVWFYQIMPATEIDLKTAEEKISFDLVAIGSVDASEIDEVNNRIPLQVIEISKTKSREFEATGEKQLEEKARGFITIYNEYSSSPQVLVATTRFESAEGKVFRILENVTVPGAEIEEGKIVASGLKVEVVADQPGADYNIGPAKFTIPGFKGSPKYAGFYGESKSAMSGGSTERVKIATQEDIDRAEEILIEEIRQEAEQSFQEQIPEDLKLIENTQKQETEALSTIEPETQTDKFLVEVESKVTALLYSQSDLEKLVELNVASKISGDKVVLAESQQIKWLEPEVDLERGEVIFSLYAEQKAAYRLDLEQIKSDLLGLSEIEVRRYFAEHDKILEAKVSFRPFWAKRVSKDKEKIKITVLNLPDSEGRD